MSETQGAIRVGAGDTWQSMTDRLGFGSGSLWFMGLNDLLAANPQAPLDVLPFGYVLSFPTPGALAAGGMQFGTVQAGDTLASLEQRYGVTEDWLHGVDGAYLWPYPGGTFNPAVGQVFYVPAPHNTAGPAGSLVVEVLDEATGLPIPGATVTAGALTQQTTALGTALFREVPAGTVVVTATFNNVSAHVAAIITDHQQTHITLTLGVGSGGGGGGGGGTGTASGGGLLLLVALLGAAGLYYLSSEADYATGRK